MNGGMIVFGLLTCLLGGYVARNARTEVERGLRWRGFDTRPIDLEDQTRAIDRTRYGGIGILSLGVLMIGWGVLDWPGDQLAGVLAMWAVGAVLVIRIATM